MDEFLFSEVFHPLGNLVDNIQESAANIFDLLMLMAHHIDRH